jgi:protein gp37
MNKTSISWVRNPAPIAGTGFSWNCFAGCSPNKPSAGCANCYAERLAATRLAHLPAYAGLTSMVDTSGETTEARSRPRWTGTVRFFPEKLAEPLRRRTLSGIFVGDMGDVALLPNEHIAAIFGVMAACPQHRFYLLTKRPARLRKWFEWATDDGARCRIVGLPAAELHARQKDWHQIRWRWPLPNVWIGTSVCTRADLGNLYELRRIPAAVRFVSFEPLLEDLGKVDLTGIAWAIVGGESGPRARPMHLEWMRSLNQQCKAAGVARWNKQLGAKIAGDNEPFCVQRWFGEGWTSIPPIIGENAQKKPDGALAFGIGSPGSAGADMSEWPEELRVRELPNEET